MVRHLPVRQILQKGCILLLCLMMLVQIGLGFAWMAGNFGTVPGFGDTTEYLNLSDSFALDEYRPVLYPLFLRLVRVVSSALGWEYQYLVYVIQAGLCLALVFVFLRRLFFERLASVFRKEQNRYLILSVFALYIWTTPMILWMNFTVLTDSFGLSFLLLMLIGLERYKTAENRKECILAGIETGAGYLLQALTRADRVYSALLCIILFAGFDLLKTRFGKGSFETWGSPFVRLAVISVSVVVSVSAVFVIRGLTQKPGDRVKTTLAYVLLDRVAWPHFSANYESMPDEVREVVTAEEAAVFDQHNNNVMYTTAPMIEARVGTEKAQEIYRQIAGTVWQNEPGTVIRDITDDILTFAGAPVTFWLSSKGQWSSTNTGWNIHCLSAATPELTELCRQYYTWSLCNAFVVLAGIGIVLLLFAAGRKTFGGKMCEKQSGGRRYALGGTALMSVIIILWFSLGDGAPPNDRYLLILYFLYDALLIRLALLPGVHGKQA